MAEIEPGKVYVGKCGVRFRRYTADRGIFRFEQAMQYSRRGLLAVAMPYNRISKPGARRWVAREATPEETAAFVAVMGSWSDASQGESGGPL